MLLTKKRHFSIRHPTAQYLCRAPSVRYRPERQFSCLLGRTQRICGRQISHTGARSIVQLQHETDQSASGLSPTGPLEVFHLLTKGKPRRLT